MKKSALLAAALVISASTAWAYDNPTAGFSVRDGKPFYRMESAGLYAYSSFGVDEFAKLESKAKGSMHIVNFFDTAAMSKILGVEYNDAYFSSEYEKLALLGRSQLDLRTVPSPLLDLKKYALATGRGSILLQEGMLKEQLGKLEPHIRVDKLGASKIITQSYLYKESNILNEVDISLVSANNNLYVLTSVTSDSHYYVNKEKGEAAAKAAKDDAAKSCKPEAKEEKSSDKVNPLQAEAVKPTTLPEALRKQLWQEHLKLLKGFKAFQPTNNQQALQYVDSYKGKAVVLPQDWLYAQLQFKEKEARGCFTMAVPVENLRKLFAELDYFGIYKQIYAASEPQKLPETKQAEQSNAITDKMPELDAKQQKLATGEGRKALRNFDALLMTMSYQTKDKDFQEMAESALASKLGADMLLAETLNALKNSRLEQFALESFKYKLHFTPSRAGAVIAARTKWLKEFTYDNLLELDLTKNAGSFLLYAHKPAVATATELEKSMREWQF